MIYKDLFHVEGGLYCSEQTLFYKTTRLCTVVTEQGDRTDYNARRRELYRLRDKFINWQSELDLAGFEIVLKSSNR